jgi:murein DD-endopeptidase MepM/ murein hydrolase activator NlpD
VSEAGADECSGEAGLCILPNEHWDKQCSDPDPAPTPTTFYMTGGPFYWHQRVWVPVLPTTIPDHLPGNTPMPPQEGKVGLMLDSWGHLGGTCFRFDFEVKNTTMSPIDFDLPAQAFMRCKSNTNIYTVDVDRYDSADDYPETHLNAGETRRISVPICHQCPQDPLLGVMTSGYQSQAGTSGLSANTFTGADTAIYFQWKVFVDQDCGHTREPRGFYPEIEDPPAEPKEFLYAGAIGIDGEAGAGHSGGNTPVTVPPCLRITRGFGCDDYPTGVAGGDRCPPSAPYWHTGVDYSCYTGTPVYTPLGGALVHSTGTGYGNLAKVIVSEHGQTIQMYYAHLSVFAQSDFCHSGGICHSGSKVGRTGNTGFSTGPHLHWELRVNNVPVDPFQYWSALPEGGARPPVAGIEGLSGPEPSVAQSGETSNGGSSVLAAPALQPTPVLTGTVPPPERYPLHIRTREIAGAPIAGVEVALSDSEGEEVVATCITGGDGRCAVDLPSGVYRVQLGGEVDGHPVDPVGDVNVEAMESEREEYYFGPLAVWHDPPHSTSGFVLTADESGVLQPVMDADPTGDVPQPVNPVELVRPEATPAPVTEETTAPATMMLPGQTPQPEVTQVTEPPLSPTPTMPPSPTPTPEVLKDGSLERLLGLLACLAGVGLLALVVYLSTQIRQLREEKGTPDEA